MDDLNYGYEITIAQDATFDPSGTASNQWQRQVPGNTNWESVAGATGETYTVASSDRSAKLRLEQSLNGVKAYSNELQVTRDEPKPKVTSLSIGNSGNVLVVEDEKLMFTPFTPYTGRRYAILYDTKDGTTKNGSTTTASRTNTRTSPNFVKLASAKVIGIPSQFEDIYTINSKTAYPYKYQDSDLGTNGNVGGYPAYYGGVLANNDKAYWIPYSVTTMEIVEYTPSTGKIKKCGSVEGNSQGVGADTGYKGSTLAPNNKIYARSGSGSKLLEFDPETYEVNYYSPPDNNVSGEGLVLTPYGTIIMAPYSNKPWVTEFDYITKTFSTWGLSENATPKYISGCLAPDGKVYCPDQQSGLMVVIDSKNKTLEEFRIAPEPTNTVFRFVNSILGSDGCIYVASASNIDKSLKIDLGFSKGPTWTMPGLPGDVLDCTSRYHNKF